MELDFKKKKKKKNSGDRCSLGIVWREGME
jgi:hypothetical protein